MDGHRRRSTSHRISARRVRRHKDARQRGFRENRSRLCPTLLSVRNLLSVERVEVANHVMEAGGIEMSVDLGGLDTSMAKKLLQDA